MRKRFGDSLIIEISAATLRILQVQGWFRRRTTLLIERNVATGTPAGSLPGRALREALTEAQCAGIAATIILPQNMTRLFMATPPKDSARLADYRAAAGLRFSELYGEPTDGWHLEADWNTDNAFPVCALPHAVEAELQEIVREYRLSPIGIVPRFVADWNRWHAKLQPTAWFGAVHDRTLTLGIVSQGRLQAVRTVTVAADAWTEDAWLPLHLEREALRLDLPLPDRLFLCGTLPGHWARRTIGKLDCVRLDAGSTTESNAVSLP